MRLPSVKTIESRMNVSADIAKSIRQILENYDRRWNLSLPRPVQTFGKISDLIGGLGYEYLPAGNNEKSPKIHYVNRGDTYDETVLFVNGRFSIGSWGAIVERGNYT